MKIEKSKKNRKKPIKKTKKASTNTKKAPLESKVDASLLNLISPISIEIKRGDFNMGDVNGRILGVIKYPEAFDYGWLGKLLNIKNTLSCVSFTPIDSAEFTECLSSNASMQNIRAEMAKSPLERTRAEKSAEDSEKMMKQIDQQDETVGKLGITIMTLGDEESITSITKRTIGTIGYQKMRSRVLTNLQGEAFKHLSPFYPINPNIENVIGKPAPLSTIMGGFPFSSSGFNDNAGYIIGSDSVGGLVIVDPWLRMKDRTNSNMIVTGIAGMGKSTAIKLVAMQEYLRGTKVIFIDPEREYKEMCNNLNGDWINIGGGSGTINPLEIKPVPLDDDEDKENGEVLYRDEGMGMGAKALHIKTLEVFLQLYNPTLLEDDILMALLKDAIIKLYDQYQIFWETDVTKLGHDEFPTFKNLYDYLKELEDNHDKWSSEYQKLALMLQDIAVGADSFIWSSPTNIKSTSRMICLDTRDLQNSSDQTKRAQYFNALTWAWQQMSADRSEKVLLICDEGYLLCDPNVPQSLVFLRNVEKRDRKYEAGLIFATHSINDLLSPQVKMYGQALLDIPCIKMIFGTDGQNLKETKELYSLTEAEEEFLSGKTRRSCLLMIGAKRLRCNIDVSQEKLDFFGKAGGR